jgi:hypothetical protein
MALLGADKLNKDTDADMNIGANGLKKFSVLILSIQMYYVRLWGITLSAHIILHHVLSGYA